VTARLSRAAYPQWEYDLLDGLGVKASSPTYGLKLRALNLWSQAEGMQTYGSNFGNNPLAIGGGGPGQTSCVAQCGGSSPIYLFDTAAHGTAALVSFLQSDTTKDGTSTPTIATTLKSHRFSAQALVASIAASGWDGIGNASYPAPLVAWAGSPTGTPDVYGAPGATGIPPAGAYTTRGANGTGGPQAGCNAKGNVFGTPGLPLVGGSISFTYCEAKALLGGMLTVFGGFLMLGGITLIAVYGLNRVAPAAGRAITRGSPGPKGMKARAGAATSLAKVAK